MKTIYKLAYGAGTIAGIELSHHVPTNDPETLIKIICQVAISIVSIWILLKKNKKSKGEE